MKMAIGGKRMCGKTTQLIIQSNHERKYIVCANSDRRSVMVSLAERMGLDIPFPITVDELPLKSRFIGSVLVDDVESVLYELIGKNVSMFSTSYKFRRLDSVKGM